MQITPEFLHKYNQPGPRYTSYPPANHFTESFNAASHSEAIRRSNTEQPQAISLYVHIPFCPKLCYFCGCTTQIGGRDEQIVRYVDAVIREINMTAPLMDNTRPVTQIHWGGGTPNSIPMAQIRRIMDTIYAHFTLTPHAEVAMECSPAYLEFEDIDELRDMGFNRISMGIQDLRADVLASINRDAPKHPVKKLVDYMKAKGFEGVNLDLVYGLPRQTVDSFLDTVAKIVEIRPDRLVTFSYAHVPWVKKGQVVLEKYGLPTPEEKMQMLVQSMEYLNAQGYQTIGMDHYALPTDSLAQALATKKLHRNFQGYCTRETTGQVYGFGASSISQLQGAYSQNLKVTRDYMNAIEAGNFPTERGYSLSVIEQIRRDVINEIMCNAFLDFDEIATKYDKPTDEIKEIVAYEAHKLDSFVADSLVNISGNQITISEAGRLIVRNIAMV
ncbi:MAG: hypothetical protein RIS47_1976, partial [Bacteroidota bacterium]